MFPEDSVPFYRDSPDRTGYGACACAPPPIAHGRNWNGKSSNRSPLRVPVVRVAKPSKKPGKTVAVGAAARCDTTLFGGGNGESSHFAVARSLGGRPTHWLGWLPGSDWTWDRERYLQFRWWGAGATEPRRGKVNAHSESKPFVSCTCVRPGGPSCHWLIGPTSLGSECAERTPFPNGTKQADTSEGKLGSSPHWNPACLQPSGPTEDWNAMPWVRSFYLPCKPSLLFSMSLANWRLAH
jgi:hypothetical protein